MKAHSVFFRRRAHWGNMSKPGKAIGGAHPFTVVVKEQAASSILQVKIGTDL